VQGATPSVAEAQVQQVLGARRNSKAQVHTLAPLVHKKVQPQYSSNSLANARNGVPSGSSLGFLQ